jgi:hypothetical protein
MLLETVVREYPNGKKYVTLVNAVTRRHVAAIAPADNLFTTECITTAVNLYHNLLNTGLLIQVLAAVEKRLVEQPKTPGV